MNRNVESHFSMLPSADIQRSRFDRSQDVKFTFNVGELIPFFIDEVLPGDTFDITTSKVVRLQTLITPVMDNIYLDTYFFFVPNRLVWTHWRNLMGENTGSAWIPQTEYTVPQLVMMDSAEGADDGGVDVGDILDYMGVPVGVSAYDNNYSNSVSALPYRCYQLIYQEWFRDENLINPPVINTGDSNNTYSSLTQKKPFKVAKYHDYFTSALPDPQKGPRVAAPIYSVDDAGIPVHAMSKVHGITGDRALHGLGIKADQTQAYVRQAFETIPSGSTTQPVVGVEASATVASQYGFIPDNLYADITSGTVGININNLRYAIQVQKLYERDARGGTRYIELIKSHFGVDSPDARMQRPEYLGGNRIPISIHQIVNQSQGESDFLGDLGAMSLTTDRNNDFVKSFTEHGFIIGLCCARYDHSYPQGLERFWQRKNRFDFYWPVFANLGEQDIRKSEIYWTGESDNLKAFGYQERWAEYRYKPNRVAAEMRPGVSNTLASWHFADYYTDQPTLSSGWIVEDKSNVDRTLAVTSAVSNQLFCDIYIQNYTTRPMPVYSIPGLMDHF